MTRNVVRVAEALVRLRRDRGTLIHLDIEPEPDCALENTDETVAFFEQLAVPGRRAAARRSARRSADDARARLCTNTSGSASTAATSRSNSRIPRAALERLQRPGSGSAACN